MTRNQLLWSRALPSLGASGRRKGRVGEAQPPLNGLAGANTHHCWSCSTGHRQSRGFPWMQKRLGNVSAGSGFPATTLNPDRRYGFWRKVVPPRHTVPQASATVLVMQVTCGGSALTPSRIAAVTARYAASLACHHSCRGQQAQDVCVECVFLGCKVSLLCGGPTV